MQICCSNEIATTPASVVGPRERVVSGTPWKWKQKMYQLFGRSSTETGHGASGIHVREAIPLQSESTPYVQEATNVSRLALCWGRRRKQKVRNDQTVQQETDRTNEELVVWDRQYEEGTGDHRAMQSPSESGIMASENVANANSREQLQRPSVTTEQRAMARSTGPLPDHRTS